jgi:hypothetical protein
MVENLHRRVNTRRLKGILAWRAEDLSMNERSKVNHPTVILRRWKKDTEPMEEKRAARLQKEMQEPKQNPHLEVLADAEVREHDARRHAEDLRLLGLEEVEDLHGAARGDRAGCTDAPRGRASKAGATNGTLAA